jgi:hypothetical protein
VQDRKENITADSNSGSDSNSNSDSDSDSNSNSDSNSDSDGDNTSDYKPDSSSDSDSDGHGDGDTDCDTDAITSSPATRARNTQISGAQMMIAAQLKQSITAQLKRLRSSHRDCSRVDKEGKKITSRSRSVNCPISPSVRIAQLIADEDTRLFRRVCANNSQSKNAFLKQSAQFLTYAADISDHLFDCENDALVTLIEKVVMAPTSVVTSYADYLEDVAVMAHESIRGRLCNVSLLLIQFLNNVNFRTEIPPVLAMIKARVKYHKECSDHSKASTSPAALMKSGLLCTKADLIVMEEKLVPILCDIFHLAEIQAVPMQLYNLAMRIIGFQFYGTNLNGRYRGIAEMTEEEGLQLIKQLYAASSKTKSLKARGDQMITVTSDLATNLDSYWRLLRPKGTESANFFLRFKGTSISGDDGSKGIATMLDDLFGLYLTVTTLRCINTTQVKICATENEINSEQSDVFHTESQGHSRETANRLYTYMRQPNTAAVLADVNSALNNRRQDDTVMFATCEGEAEVNNESGSTYHLRNTPSTPPNNGGSCSHSTIGGLLPMKLQMYDDFGLDHVDHGKAESGNITWSNAEVAYIMQFKSTCTERSVFRLCLDSILSNPNADIRRIFHKKHLRSSSILRDGVKYK